HVHVCAGRDGAHASHSAEHHVVDRLSDAGDTLLRVPVVQPPSIDDPDLVFGRAVVLPLRLLVRHLLHVPRGVGRLFCKYRFSARLWREHNLVCQTHMTDISLETLAVALLTIALTSAYSLLFSFVTLMRPWRMPRAVRTIVL